MTQKNARRGFTQINWVGPEMLSSSPLAGEVRRSRDGGLSNRKTFFNTLLPRLTAVLPPQGREMFRGFTLIELLVVVLIIGILAAVALPQYQVAVEKSRVSPILSVLKTLANAQKIYYLENGKYAFSLDELAVDIPDATAVEETTDRTYYTTPTGIHYLITSSVNQIYAGTDLFQFNRTLNNDIVQCFAKADSLIAQRVCKSFGVKNAVDATCGLITIGERVPCKGGDATNVY